MKTFLEYVADDIIARWGADLSRLCIVFPNKRASLFLNEYLARRAGRPVWSPAYVTISELFRQHSPEQVADPVKLVCDLHRCFVRQTGFDETLDHFYGWGQVLLADFDDVDKNMAPPERVFANLRDLHELDDASYLTPAQREAIRRFFSTFSDDHDSELRQRFLRLWSHIGDIYADFNQTLLRQGLAYEGALYRRVATDESIRFDYEHYLFVGFNVVQPVEQLLFSRLQREGRAHFYWDYDDYYMQSNEAGYYVSQLVARFPNELAPQADELYRNFGKAKHITYIAATTENLQARYVSQWLRAEGRIAAGRRTAIVLCDESLLPVVIHALPPEVGHVNITTGYPLTQTPAASLTTLLVQLQTVGRDQQHVRFRRKQLDALMAHPYAQYLPPLLPADEGLAPWLVGVLRHVAIQMGPTADPLAAEALFRTYTLLNRLAGLVEQGDLRVDTPTLQRLIGQLLGSTTIPFHGEPAVGLQVMGVLETRNLDFDHVLLLSCNDGNMPRGTGDTSFIPYSLRRAYGLTTPDHKVAIYSYYFHRLLQRATDVTMTYNQSTQAGHTGEMSRFMQQLLVESPHVVERLQMHTPQTVSPVVPRAVGKSPEVMEALLERFDKRRRQTPEPNPAPLLTPTAINRYLRCPLQFYYCYVEGLREPDDTEEGVIDNRIFGNIFHDAAQLLYERIAGRSRVVERQDIEPLLKNKAAVERAVDETISQQLGTLQLNGMQLINREVIVHYLQQLLHVDARLAPFELLGLEHDVACDLQLPGLTTTIGGRIDRLDRVGQLVRVVDYKTGARVPRPLPTVESIFDPAQQTNHSDYYLQTFVYANIVRATSQQPVAPALLFIQHASGDDYDPVLRLGSEPVADVAHTSAEFAEGLRRVCTEMFAPDVPFTPTPDTDRCRTCPYRSFCGL